MKRTERVGTIVKILTDSPNQIFSLQYFCDLFDSAKSSISEDLQTANNSIEFSGYGHLETISGAKGGVKYVPDISMEKISELQTELCEKLSDPTRMVGGNFLYTSDLFFDHSIVMRLALIFSKVFKDCEADYVATIETKGIPLAYMVSHYLNLPLVVIRREAKISEGSTVSINYFSGSNDRLQKMSMSKRAIVPNSKILVIDDFMRGGGSIFGITEMIKEFNSTVVGIGVAIASSEPEKKKVSNYASVIYLGDFETNSKVIPAYPNNDIL